MKKHNDKHLILGIEGGGTKTDWVYLEQKGNDFRLIRQGRLGPTNFRLISQEELVHLLQSLPRHPAHAGVFLAGCVTAFDRARLLRISRSVWLSTNIVVGSDRESGFAAAFGQADGILVVSGTGSAVTGRKNGRLEFAGGRGHLLGDRGGAYIICLEGLRLALRDYDLNHRITPLAESILRALSLNRIEDLIGWTQIADKKEISSLAPVLFEAAMNGDRSMKAVIESGASALAQYTQSVARWLDFTAPAVKLMGGLFLNQQAYAQLYESKARALLPLSSIELCRRSGAIGAAYLASQRKFQPESIEVNSVTADYEKLTESITEAVNPGSRELQRLGKSALIRLFIQEEKHVEQALSAAETSLRKGVDMLVKAFRNGGKLYYVGAGTSGRLGVLDASEIPPTFGEPPDRIQAIIAGGAAAIVQSVEAAEDDELQGRLAIVERGVRASDVVCGISASGRTPFVLAALRQSQKIHARTMLITCNPKSDFSADLLIVLSAGPELLAGSTRLKCGTATKVALNILSTCAMIRLGKVYGNRMVDLKATSSKLRQRAIRLVSEIKHWPHEKAEKQLRKYDWNVRKVLDQ